jgi:UDP-N-acetylglucosamine diphosphorylase / glucose-1-phosphate thymidylyltransferase / UDP-N-acetylgalactosamine diphosphorylase / glucosamine-1-phosphate N-acetyltransferase / galactosamine-1-phosphate N-acetyltransferase
MKQAVILAAGEGRRLRPFTVNNPKSMLRVAGKPIIQYVLEALAENGLRDIIMVVGYRKEQIFDYIGDGSRFGVEIRYKTQSKQLGTANALSQSIDAADEEFLVLAGDKLIFPEALSRIIHQKPPALLFKKEKKPSQYGVVKVLDNKLVGITEKPEFPESNLINTGIYTFNRKIFDFIDSRLDIPEVLNEMLIRGIDIAAIETGAEWQDIIYPWDILNLNASILQKIHAVQNGIIEAQVFLNGPVNIGRGTVVRSNTYITGPVVIGEGCEIGPYVNISPSTSIADNVVISPFTEIKNSVISHDVHIGTNSVVQDSVIDKGCILGGHFCAYSEDTKIIIGSENHLVKVGAMIGESCSFGHGVITQPGAIVGNYSQVRSLKVVSGNLPERSMVV